MKKRLLIFSISAISCFFSMGQGALKSTFNNPVSNGTLEVTGSRVIVYSEGATTASAGTYVSISLDPTTNDLFAAGQVTISGNQKIILSRFTKTGTLVNTFGTGGHVVFDVLGTTDQTYAMAISSGNVYIVGMGREASGAKQPFIASYTTSGSLNYINTFAFTTTNNPLGTVSELATCIAVDANGKLVVGGITASGSSNEDFAVARFNTDGTLDAANFNVGATAPAKAGTNIFDIRVLLLGTSKNDRCDAVAITSGGNIILGGEYERTGSETDFCFVNLTSAGVRNTSWGSASTGIVTYDLHLGTSVTQGTSVTGEYVDVMKTMILDGSGNIFAAGSTTMPSGFVGGSSLRVLMSVAKLNAAGALDASFGGNGVAIIDPISIYGSDPGSLQGTSVNSIALYRGKIILGSSYNGGDFFIVRLNADSTLDPIFKYDYAVTAKSGISRINVGSSDAINSIISSGTELFAAGNSYGLNSAGSSFTKPTVLNIENSFYTLPINNLGFIAQKQSSSVQLQWKPQIDQSLTLFTVERSTDGRNYRPIGSVTANASQTSNYSFLDNAPVASVNYYRLAIKNTDDKVVFSNALAVRNSKASAGLEVFPNPASQLVYVQLPSSLRGKMNVRMNDVMGRTVATMSFDMMGEATTTSMNIASLNKGIYTISVVDELGSVISSKHFVKN